MTQDSQAALFAASEEMSRSAFNALMLWRPGYRALADIEANFDRIFHLEEEEVTDIDEVFHFIEQNSISYVFIQNPYQNETRLGIYRALRAAGFPVIVSDRGALDDSWFFDPGGFNAESPSYRKENWDYPLPAHEQEKVVSYIQHALESTDALEAQGQRLSEAQVRKRLGIGSAERVIFVPLQRPEDTVIQYMSGSLGGMPGFVTFVNELARLLPSDWRIVAKKHPLEKIHPGLAGVVWAPDDMHFKDLLDLCSAVLLINSGVGVHAMMHGKRVFYCGEVFYGHEAVNTAVQSPQAVIANLNSENLSVDEETTQRFIGFLLNRFYSFGEFTTELVDLGEQGRITATQNVRFRQLRGVPSKSNSRTLIVTHIKFWILETGSQARILQLVQYLHEHLSLRVLFLGVVDEADKQVLRSLGLERIVDDFSEITLPKAAEKAYEPEPDYPEWLKKYHKVGNIRRFHAYLGSREFDTLIFEYIRLDYLLTGLDRDKYRLILDTHDLMCLRTQSYHQYGARPSIEVPSMEEEIRILDKYDKVVLIQEEELKFACEHLDSRKLILAPHGVELKATPVFTSERTDILFVAGKANQEHILWFLEEVWPYFAGDDRFKLNICGGVCDVLPPIPFKNVSIVGKVGSMDEVYYGADIAINPVRFGSGLKIKNVEALSYGVPLITSPIGAQGMEDGAGCAFLVASDVEEWRKHLLALGISPELRIALANNGLSYVEKSFNLNKCYGELVELLRSGKSE